DLGGNIPGQLAAPELLRGLTPLFQRRAVAREGRHDHLPALLARPLPDGDAPPVGGGQTLGGRLPYGAAPSSARAALRHPVGVLAGSGLDASGRSEDYLRIHYLATPADLTEAVHRLAGAWRAYRPPAARVTAPAAMSV